VAAGADGVFMETHADPSIALCDGPNMIPMAEVGALLQRLKAIHALVRSPGSGSRARVVLADVYLTTEPSDVRAALADPDPGGRLRVYSGYAGWAAGQLAAEVRSGVWVIDRADAASVFSADPVKLWPRVHRILNRLEARARSEVKLSDRWPMRKVQMEQ